MQYLGNSKQLAQILDLTERRVNQIANKGEIFQRDPSGNFNIVKCVENYYREKFSLDETEAKKLKYGAQLKQLQAEQLELKNSIARSDYLLKSEVIQELSSYFTVLKRSLSSLARKLSIEIGPLVDASTGRRIEKQLTEVINDALEQLAVEGVYEAPKERKVKG